MGNIMICGSLCHNCEVENETQVNKNNAANNYNKIMIDGRKEREKCRAKIEKIIQIEVELLQKNIDDSAIDLKERVNDQKNIINRVEDITNKNIETIQVDIEKIKTNHLLHIEKDLTICSTQIGIILDNIKSLQDISRDTSNNTAQNSAKLDILISLNNKIFLKNINNFENDKKIIN